VFFPRLEKSVIFELNRVYKSHDNRVVKLQTQYFGPFIFRNANTALKVGKFIYVKSYGCDGFTKKPHGRLQGT